MVKVNGVAEDVAGKSIADYLTSTEYNLKRIAVEINGDIVPKSQYESRVMTDGDVVEIVGFVGGG